MAGGESRETFTQFSKRENVKTKGHPCTRNRLLCRGVAPAPGTPPEDGAARRNPGDDGINMLVVLTAPSRHRGAFELSRASQSAPGPTHGRRQKRSPVMGRLRPSLLRPSTAHDRCVRFAERTSMAAHSSSSPPSSSPPSSSPPSSSPPSSSDRCRFARRKFANSSANFSASNDSRRRYGAFPRS